MKIGILVILLFSIVSSSAQKSVNWKEHIKNLIVFFEKSSEFNTEINQWFEVKSKTEKEFHIVEKKPSESSSRTAMLHTLDLDIGVRKRISEGKSKNHFICQISILNDSIYVCEVYSLNHRTLKSLPSLYCNFKMEYNIKSDSSVGIIRFDKKNVM